MVLYEDRFICICISIGRSISLIFLSTLVALNILSLYQLFRGFKNFMTLFARAMILVMLLVAVFSQMGEHSSEYL